MEGNNANETAEERIPLADLPIQNEQNAKININKIKNNETTPASNHKERGDQLRRALRYNFLSYSDKWKVTHEPQGKLIYQFVKAIFVIIQLYCIGIDITKSNNNVDIIKELNRHFILDWESSYQLDESQIMKPVPVYTREKTLQYVEYAINSYANILNKTSGTYRHRENENIPGSFTLQYSFYANIAEGDYCQSNFTLINKEILLNVNSKEKLNATIEKVLGYFKSLINFKLGFPMHMSKLLNTDDAVKLQCFDLFAFLRFTNPNHRPGELQLDVTTRMKNIDCYTFEVIQEKSQGLIDFFPYLNSIIIALSTLVLGLCAWSCYKLTVLFLKTVHFFSTQHSLNSGSDQRLDFSSMAHFFDFWLFAITLESTLFAFASARLLLYPPSNQGDQVVFYRPEADPRGVITGTLATGNFLFWVSFIRYLSFYPTYAVLFATIRHVLPRLGRFLVGVLILFGAFCCSCWLVLGLVHGKFSTFGGTSQALFGLMNGDEVFGTLDGFKNGDSESDDSNSVLYLVLLRLLIVAFVLLFIFIVLSITIAIITETYEEVKGHNIEDEEVDRRLRRGTLAFSSGNLAQFLRNREEKTREEIEECSEMVSPCWYKWFREQLKEDRKKLGKNEHRYVSWAVLVSAVGYCCRLFGHNLKTSALILLNNVAFWKKPQTRCNCSPQCIQAETDSRSAQNETL